jgi:hypothetical protein
MVVGLVQVIGLLIVTGQYQYYLEYIGVSFIYFILLVWVIMVLVMPFERQPEIDFSQVNGNLMFSDLYVVALGL